MSFDTVVMVDWSGGNDRGAAPKQDAIWAAVVREGAALPSHYLRTCTHGSTLSLKRGASRSTAPRLASAPAAPTPLSATAPRSATTAQCCHQQSSPPVHRMLGSLLQRRET